MPIDPGRRIRVADAHPANQGVLAYLRTNERARTSPLSAKPGDVPDPYYQLGTHPDIVEHLWDKLGRALPEDCRCVVLACVALVQPKSGVVIALGLGTSYALRLTAEDLVDALASEHETTHHYSTSGDYLDVGAWGEGWCFGRFDRRERGWCGQSFEQYGDSKTGLDNRHSSD